MGDMKADGTLYVKAEGGEYIPLGKVTYMTWTEGDFIWEMIREDKDENRV